MRNRRTRNFHSPSSSRSSGSPHSGSAAMAQIADLTERFKSQYSCLAPSPPPIIANSETHGGPDRGRWFSLLTVVFIGDPISSVISLWGTQALTQARFYIKGERTEILPTHRYYTLGIFYVKTKEHERKTIRSIKKSNVPSVRYILPFI